jgi:hypothetical protein
VRTLIFSDTFKDGNNITQILLWPNSLFCTGSVDCYKTVWIAHASWWAVDEQCCQIVVLSSKQALDSREKTVRSSCR